MPIYQPEPENDSPSSVRRRPYQSFSCSLLHFGPIALYYRVEVMEQDLAKLASERFAIRQFNCSHWQSGEVAHQELKARLEFPEYYGMNLHALRDSLLEMPISDEGGLALVFRSYHTFTASHPDLAVGILDAVAATSRLNQIFGKSLLALVQTSDPSADYGKLGAVQACWNQAEFLREKRCNA